MYSVFVVWGIKFANTVKRESVELSCGMRFEENNFATLTKNIQKSKSLEPVCRSENLRTPRQSKQNNKCLGQCLKACQNLLVHVCSSSQFALVPSTNDPGSFTGPGVKPVSTSPRGTSLRSTRSARASASCTSVGRQRNDLCWDERSYGRHLRG